MTIRQKFAIGAALILVALFLLWPILIAVFDVNPRVFPGVGAVAAAAVETIRDGSLVMHVAASLGRVLVGTLLGVLVAHVGAPPVRAHDHAGVSRHGENHAE